MNDTMVEYRSVAQIRNKGTTFKRIVTVPLTIIHLTNNVNKINPADIYLLEVNNRNTRTRSEICSKLTIKTPEQRHNGVVVSLYC